MKRSNKRLIATGLIAALSSTLLVACADEGSSTYAPNASTGQLAAYAARAQYPANAQPQEDPHLTATVNRSLGHLTMRNFGSVPLRDFNVWVNQAYVLHVDHIDANGSRTIDLPDLYNSTGGSFQRSAADSVRKVQVQTNDGILYNVQGPQYR
jgi:hypothetical protein